MFNRKVRKVFYLQNLQNLYFKFAKRKLEKDKTNLKSGLLKSFQKSILFDLCSLFCFLHNRAILSKTHISRFQNPLDKNNDLVHW